MATDISDYDYSLPAQSIAQFPIDPPEQAKLMIVSRNGGILQHRHVADLPSFIGPNDIVVINNTKVFRARLFGTLTTPAGFSRSVELFLVRPTQYGWLALAKPGKHCVPGSTIHIDKAFTATILSRHEQGTIEVTFNSSVETVMDTADRIGHVPVPPYIKTEPTLEAYQTTYAKVQGSVAAPTAGLHLTNNMLDTLKKSGTTIVEITLHVGLGTFLPVKSPTLESHTMHSEWVHVSQKAAKIITDGKARGKRIIAIGTTTVRTLEGVAKLHDGQLAPYTGDISLFITPGFSFSVVDGIFTNFHLPKSTLLVLVSSYAGREHILKAYTQAIENKYRFYSFGDAMLIL